MPPEYRRQRRSYGILWALVVIALVVLAFYLGSRYGAFSIPQQPASSTPTTTVTTVEAGSEYYSNPAEWQTYSDTAAGYSIAYPIDFSADEPNAPKSSTDWMMNNVAQAPGLKTFTLTIPSAFEPQTNFADATLTVGYSTNSKAIANCLLAQNGEATGTPATTNGTSFDVFTVNDAGAGNLYDTTSYRTVSASRCYVVEYTIHSSQIANYPSSYDLQPFNEGQVQAVLDKVVGTFTFL